MLTVVWTSEVPHQSGSGGLARRGRRGTLMLMTRRDQEPIQDVELQDAVHQADIYDAIAVAASDAHAVLDTVLGASDPDAARRALQDRYGFTAAQAWAVMDLQVRRLTSSDLRTFEERRRELAARIAVLEQGRDGA
jgi:DNA gyrase/topoisomerase IV subunit A